MSARGASVHVSTRFICSCQHAVHLFMSARGASVHVSTRCICSCQHAVHLFMSARGASDYVSVNVLPATSRPLNLQLQVQFQYRLALLWLAAQELKTPSLNVEATKA
jgi:hypothetical protein